MQQHRIISLLSILVMLIIPVIGWFLVAQPQLAAASSAEQLRTEAASQVAASQIVVDQLKADSAKLPELNDELNELRGSIPAEIDPDGWLDGLSALAKVSQVQITQFTVTDAVAYAPAIAPVDPNAPVVEAPAEGTEGEGEAAPTETPVVAPAAYPGIVTNPLVDSSNFVAIPVTVDVTGNLKTIFRFVNGLQTDNRLYLVTGVAIEPAAEQGNTYIGKIAGYIWAIPTGVEGKQRPVSTVVKSMDPPTPPESETETETPDPNATNTPSPNPTETPEG